MRKVAVFTEGQTEQVFVREMIQRLIDNSTLSYTCVKLIASETQEVPYSFCSPNPTIHFLIINAQGDGTVLSAIQGRGGNLIDKQGYERIIGVRDMYCRDYRRLSGGVIDEGVTQRFIGGFATTIAQMPHAAKVSFHFAVMEIEAWFLAMYYVFTKIDPSLTLVRINDSLGTDLANIDPQQEFYHPVEQIQDILALCGQTYHKKRGDSEKIARCMDTSDFDAARENGRCACFDVFYREMKSYA